MDWKKRIILPLALLVAVFTARADGNAWEIIGRMAANMTEYGDYRMDFTASAKGMHDVGGMYIVSGDSYYMKVQKQEQFSDGVSRWEVDPSNKEVIIDRVNLDERNILLNPTKAFDFAADEFDARYMGVETVNGIRSHAIELMPTGKLGGIGVVTLYVSVAAEIPVAVSYDFEGERLTVRVDKFTAVAEVENGGGLAAQFVFDPEKYQGYEIIDFR